MIFFAVAIAATVSSIAAVLIARMLRLPWWANLLAAVVAWLGLALQLSIWEAIEGELPWMSAKMAVLPALAGGFYAVVTRGVIGPPDGPIPRGQ